MTIGALLLEYIVRSCTVSILEPRIYRAISSTFGFTYKVPLWDDVLFFYTNSTIIRKYLLGLLLENRTFVLAAPPSRVNPFFDRLVANFARVTRVYLL